VWVGIAGDGGLQITIQEMATLVQENCAVKMRGDKQRVPGDGTAVAGPVLPWAARRARPFPAAAGRGARLPPPQAAGSSSPPAGEIRVERLADNRFAIDEAGVTQLTTNINQYMTQVRLIPYFEGTSRPATGSPPFRPGTTFEQLGFQGGDVLQQVNGLDVSSPEKLYTIFQNLKDEKKVSVNILRQGPKEHADVRNPMIRENPMRIPVLLIAGLIAFGPAAHAAEAPSASQTPPSAVDGSAARTLPAGQENAGPAEKTDAVDAAPVPAPADAPQAVPDPRTLRRPPRRPRLRHFRRPPRRPRLHRFIPPVYLSMDFTDVELPSSSSS